jgi:hypothetical protein
MADRPTVSLADLALGAARKIGRDWTVTPKEVERYAKEHKR